MQAGVLTSLRRLLAKTEVTWCNRGYFTNNDGDAFPQSLEFRIQQSLSFVIVSEGPRQKRRLLGVSIKDAILFLGLYATLF
jgi:hypothetical protein